MTDELKPIRCRCGGEAFVSINGFIEYHVVCALCGMRTDWFRSKDKAIEAWNRAMGAKDNNVPNKFATDTNVGDKERTAKVMNDGVNYCPNCGADMRGE